LFLHFAHQGVFRKPEKCSFTGSACRLRQKHGNSGAAAKRFNENVQGEAMEMRFWNF